MQFDPPTIRYESTRVSFSSSISLFTLLSFQPSVFLPCYHLPCTIAISISISNSSINWTPNSIINSISNNSRSNSNPTSNSNSTSNNNFRWNNNSTSNSNLTSNYNSASKLRSWKRRSYLSEKRMALIGFRNILKVYSIHYILR